MADKRFSRQHPRIWRTLKRLRNTSHLYGFAETYIDKIFAVANELKNKAIGGVP